MACVLAEALDRIIDPMLSTGGGDEDSSVNEFVRKLPERVNVEVLES
jgi:hypothetical protein